MLVAEPTLHAMLQDLEELVSAESPSDDLVALARSAIVVASVGEKRLGAPPKLIEREGVTHGRWRTGIPSAPCILLIGHHDKVWPVGTIDTLPWSYRGAKSPAALPTQGCILNVASTRRSRWPTPFAQSLTSRTRSPGQP